MQIMFNSWSDGGSWSGNMTHNDKAKLQIQWIEMVFNNTDPAYAEPPRAGGCQNICSIDLTPTVGTPVLLTNAGTGGALAVPCPLARVFLVGVFAAALLTLHF